MVTSPRATIFRNSAGFLSMKAPGLKWGDRYKANATVTSPRAAARFFLHILEIRPAFCHGRRLADLFQPWSHHQRSPGNRYSDVNFLMSLTSLNNRAATAKSQGGGRAATERGLSNRPDCAEIGQKWGCCCLFPQTVLCMI